MKVRRNSSSSAPASPSNEATNPARAATPALIWAAAKCSSSATSTERTAGTAETTSYASATIRKAKFGAQKYVGSRSRTTTSPAEPPHEGGEEHTVVMGR